MDFNGYELKDGVIKFFSFIFKIIIVVASLFTGYFISEFENKYKSGVNGIQVEKPIAIEDAIVAFDQSNNLLIIRELNGKKIAVSYSPEIVESIYNVWTLRNYKQATESKTK